MSLEDPTNEERAVLVRAQTKRALAWLRSDAARKHASANVKEAIDRLLDTRVENIAEPAVLAAFFERVLEDDVAMKLVRPLIRAGILLELSRAREDKRPLGAYVSDEARALATRLLEQPDLLPEKFVRKLLTHEAFEEVMGEVVEAALREFGERANPFTAEWGLPSLLKKMGPFGLGFSAVGKSFDNLREEFDRRVEPERKRFQKAFARRALSTVADFVIKRQDKPESIALKKELLAWLLEQPVKELVAPVTDKTATLTEELASAIFRHTTTLPHFRAERRAFIALTIQAHGKQTLREALGHYDVRVDFDPTFVTDVAFPILQIATETRAFEAWLEALFHAAWGGDDPSPA